jgi:hypothetical protein
LTSTDAQVGKLIEEHSKTGRVEVSGLRAGMDREAARKYMGIEKLPSELCEERTHRTRTDPFGVDWPAIMAQIAAAPELVPRISVPQDHPPADFEQTALVPPPRLHQLTYRGALAPFGQLDRLRWSLSTSTQLTVALSPKEPRAPGSFCSTSRSR